MNLLVFFRRRPFIWFILPAVAFVGAFTLYPSVYGIWVSFTNMHFGYASHGFVGLQNYVRLFTWRHFPQVATNTFVFVVAVVLLQMSIGLLGALLLNLNLRGKRIVRTIAVLPWILPPVVIGLMFRQVFSGSSFGIMNYVIQFFGIDRIHWLNHPTRAMAIMILTLVWRGTALSFILQLGGLQTIPDELYDSARIDGASIPSLIRRIIIPLLRNSLLINLIMATAGTFNHVDIPLALTAGGPQRATEVFAVTLYKQGFEVLDAGFAAAIGTLMLVINILLTIAYLRILRTD